VPNIAFCIFFPIIIIITLYRIVFLHRLLQIHMLSYSQEVETEYNDKRAK